MWCVYCHTNKINSKRYVGITSKRPRKRWKGGSGYRQQPKFYNAIKKYGWDSFSHEILLDGLTKEEAAESEVYYIQLFRSTDAEFGYNASTGGFGGHYKMTPKTLEKKRNNSQRRPVLKLDRKTGAVLERFTSVSEAARSVGDTGSNIWSCCSRDRRQMSARGYCWAFEDEYIPENFVPPTSLLPPVAQIDKDTLEVIHIYKDVHDAADSLGLNINAIRNCCNGRTRTSQGYIWRYD